MSEPIDERTDDAVLPDGTGPDEAEHGGVGSQPGATDDAVATSDDDDRFDAG